MRDGELDEINAALTEIRTRIDKLEEQREHESQERLEKISSRSFEILDDENRVRARVHLSDGQPRLVFYDQKGVLRAALGLADNDHPELVFSNLHESFPSPREGGKYRCQINLGFDEDGYPQFQMYDDPDPSFGSVDPALTLAIHKAEWEGQENARYQSKEAGLFVRAYGRGAEKVEFFGARVAEIISDQSA